MHIQVRDLPTHPNEDPSRRGSMRKGGWVEGSKENVVLIGKEERKVVQVKHDREQ